MSGGYLRDFDQLFLFQFLNSTPGSQVSPVKNNEFWGVCGVSVECLGGVKHCLDSVWAEGEGF